MLIDLHMHTSRYSACGNATPEEMAAAAIEYGLDGIVLTEHNMMWPEQDLAILRQEFPQLLILNGIELTSDQGDDYLVLGIANQEWFAPRLPAEELTRRSQALGAVVIIAHPYRYRPEVPGTLLAFPVDGVEVASCNMHGTSSEGAERLAKEMGLFRVWDSDAHHTTTVGLYANRLPKPIHNERELAAALRRRLQRPYVAEERVRAFNRDLREQMPRIQELIAQGASDDEIRADLPILVRYTDLYAIRSGLQVWRRLPQERPEAVPGAE